MNEEILHMQLLSDYTKINKPFPAGGGIIQY